MNLYEIDMRITELVDPETGEIMDYDAFAQLAMEREAKVEGMILWFKSMTAEAKAIKEEEKNLKKRREVAENKAESLKKYICEILGGEKFSTARCAVSYRKTTSLNVEDVHTLAAWLEENGHNDLVTYEAPKVDKNEVKKLLNVGIAAPGCALVSGVSMTVR